MSPLKIIRWGILGCGKIAHKFASDLALSETGILYACASKDKQKASDFAAQYQAEKNFDSYEALAACEEIDVIYIATPHSFHYVHTMLCLQHQKHVLCEKPLAIRHEQVKHMISEAQNQNLFLMEAMWTAFLPAVEELKFKIESGEIGTVRHLSADFGFS